MGSGGSGSAGGGGPGVGGGSYAGGEGWGGTMGGGSAYGGGNLGGLGTAGTMSGGAGGAGMSGYGGGGQAGLVGSGWGGPGGSAGPNANFGGGGGLSMNQAAARGLPAPPGMRRVTEYRKGEPVYSYVQNPTFSSALPTQTNALRFRMSPTETRVFGDPYNMTGPPPGFPNPQRPGGYNNPGPKGTIGQQTGVQSTFGPGNYGNSGLMSGNPAGGGLSVGLGNRMAATGVSGGTNRSSGNVVGHDPH